MLAEHPPMSYFLYEIENDEENEGLSMRCNTSDPWRVRMGLIAYTFLHKCALMLCVWRGNHRVGHIKKRAPLADENRRSFKAYTAAPSGVWRGIGKMDLLPYRPAMTTGIQLSCYFIIEIHRLYIPRPKSTFMCVLARLHKTLLSYTVRTWGYSAIN